MHQQVSMLKSKGTKGLQIQDYTNPYPCDNNSFLSLFLHPGIELKMAFFLKKNLKFDIFDRMKPDFNLRDSSKIAQSRGN